MKLYIFSVVFKFCYICLISHTKFLLKMLTCVYLTDDLSFN